VIVCSDLHLRGRDSIPRCRGETEEEWMEHQRLRLMEIVDYANRTRSDLFIAGDIFHRAKEPHEVSTLFWECIGKLIGTCYIMQGNHDLHHRDMSMEDTSYETLKKHCAITGSKVRFIGDVEACIPFGENEVKGVGGILFLHTLAFEKEEDVPYGVKHYETADSLLSTYNKYNFIIVGDMHKPWHTTENGREVINCGSMTVQSINESKYVHGFYDLRFTTTEFVPFKTPCKIVTDSFVEAEGDRDETVDAFVEQLKEYESVSLDYGENLKNVLTQESISGNVSTVVLGWIT
jgi:DNA repair exonuclease SbcCD nuclease subunit